MRLPLGILSGMGFIGGGAILKRGDLVLGVTTAATLWFCTVIGLCFGGGQIELGTAGTALGLFVLWGMRTFERQLKQDRHAALSLTLDADGPGEDILSSSVLPRAFHILSLAVRYDNVAKQRKFTYEMTWRAPLTENQPPEFLQKLAHVPGVSQIDWKPGGNIGGGE